MDGQVVVGFDLQIEQRPQIRLSVEFVVEKCEINH